MNGIILPEVIIYNALESVIAYIRKDLSEHNGKDEEKKTILYRLMGENIDGKPLKFNHWDFFKQTKKIFPIKEIYRLILGSILKLRNSFLCI